jgi:DNA repair protein RecN (Recombination protein N)
MLAIKKIMGGEEGKTIVFDEVDQGIGGRVADLVGRRLKELTSRYQIICITHLPQIAAYGDHHFLVEKLVEGERTKTRIVKLDEEERVREIARMIGGESITVRSVDRAREMLEYAKKGSS